MVFIFFPSQHSRLAVKMWRGSISVRERVPGDTNWALSQLPALGRKSRALGSCPLHTVLSTFL